MTLSSDEFFGRAEWLKQWGIRPGIHYLNHGSFGPTPQAVLRTRQAWIEELAGDPVDFFLRRLDKVYSDAREQLASFFGATARDYVFVENATAAMNIVATSVTLSPGDEVLITNHDYGAVIRIWKRACDAVGAKLIIHNLPTPFTTTESLVESLLSAVTSRTRLLIFSHVTSATAIIFPASDICRAFHARNIPVCIDGPHALGMLPLNVQELNCDYYTASCHKWLCAPVGSGFLYVHPRVQKNVKPTILSWGKTPLTQTDHSLHTDWRSEFDWVGTRDPTPFLTIPSAIKFLKQAGLDEFRRYAHELAQLARTIVTEITQLGALVPDSPEWYGTMISLPLPPGNAFALQQAFWERYRIEVPVFEWEGNRYLRPSFHLYNNANQAHLLAEGLQKLLKQGL